LDEVARFANALKTFSVQFPEVGSTADRILSKTAAIKDLLKWPNQQVNEREIAALDAQAWAEIVYTLIVVANLDAGWWRATRCYSVRVGYIRQGREK
jgi:hypothetical protein